MRSGEAEKIKRLSRQPLSLFWQEIQDAPNCGDLCSQDSLITQFRHLHMGSLKTPGAEVRLRLLSYLLKDALIKQSLN